MAEFQPKSATEAIVARTLRDGANGALFKRSGYTYINGSLIPNALSPLPARAIRAGRIVRPGIGMTEEFTASIDPKKIQSVTVQLQTNVGVRVRTVKDGIDAGTEGNDGLINLNPKIIPSTTPFEIPLRQLEDQGFFFPQMQLQTMLFDEVVETVSNYMDNVTNGIDSYHMAKALSYSMHRGARKLASSATKTDPSQYNNVIVVNKNNVYDDVYMIKKINELNAKLANGDEELQLMSFSGPREIAARPELIGYLKSPKTGYVINSDIATKLLYEPNFDMTEALRVGSQSRGEVQGYQLQEAPQGIFSLVEKWLNLPAGSLDGVLGIVFTPQAYAAGGVGKKEISMLQGTQYDGVVAFPFIKYGGASYRIQYIIAYDDWSVPAALQNADNATPVKAPKEWYANGLEPIEKVIYDANGNPVGVDVVANVLKPNGGTNCAVTLTVTGTGSAAVSDALVAATANSKALPVLNNADGTYVVSVPKSTAATITITATGYNAATVNLTAKQTAGDTFAKTQSLTATGT